MNNTLPTWQECNDKRGRDEDLNDLEQFIYTNEPMYRLGSEQFRTQLATVLKMVMEGCAEENNRSTAHKIAQNQALHPEAQDLLEEYIFTELQIAQTRGEVLARHRMSQNMGIQGTHNDPPGISPWGEALYD